MCQRSKELEAEYQKLKDSYNSHGLLMVISGIMFVGVLIWNGPVVVAITTGIVTYISYTKMNAAEKKMSAKWQEIQGTGCVSVDDTRHEKFHTQQRPQYNDSQYTHQPLTQNPLDVNDVIRSYVANAQSVRITPDEIHITRNDSHTHDAEPILYDYDELPERSTQRFPRQGQQRQLPPIDESNRAVVNRRGNERVRRGGR